MSYPVKIGGVVVELAWTQDIARRYPFRASVIGGAPTMAEFANPKKATAAVTRFLWLLLPPATQALYPLPEDLFLAIDHEADAPAIHAALRAVLDDMDPTEEKKTSSPS